MAKMIGFLQLYPFCLCDFSVFVDIRNELETVPNLCKEGLGDFILWAVDFPSTHVTDLVFGPQEVFVGEAAIVIEVCSEIF